MTLLQLFAVFIAGIIVTLGWKTYAWPVIQRKRSIKARTAKAVATRKRKAVAAASEGGHE